MNLRLTWSRKLRAVLKYLQSLNTPVAKQTLNVIQQGKVVILNFSQFTPSDYAELFSEENDEKKLRYYMPTKMGMNQLASKYEGMIYNNRIYLNDEESDIKTLARTLAHEINHFLNDSNNHYRTARDKLIEEVRAEIAEDLLEKSNLKFTPAYLKSKADFVLEVRKFKVKSSTILPQDKKRILKGLPLR